MTLVLVIGESGSGKSTAIRTLNPKETLLIQVLNKPLPFRGAAKNYIATKEKCNKLISDDSGTIIKYFKKAIESKKFKNVIIDDFQYLMANEFMRRAEEKGWEKFTDIAKHAWDIIDVAANYTRDTNVFILSHSETTDVGKVKCKTIGRLLDDKITLEGMFTIVLYAKVLEGKYVFQTQNDGYTTAKSPLDMFEDILIPNDLQFVADKINSYYNEDIGQ